LLTLQATRKDGFDGPIQVQLKDAPAGYEICGGVIPSGTDQVRATIRVPANATPAPVAMKAVGSARIGGREIHHAAQPVENMMQAFFYWHMVPAQEVLVSVGGRSTLRDSVRLLGESPVKIPCGGTVRVQLAGAGYSFTDRVELEISEGPEGVAIDKIYANKDRGEIVLKTDAAKAKVGTRGNLIIYAYNKFGGGPAKGGRPVKPGRNFVGTLPAIPFEIVGAASVSSAP
jgi:hypothetical protein